MTNFSVKKFVSLLLCMVLLVGILPMGALEVSAAEVTVYVNGLDVTDGSNQVAGVTYDKSKKTLTLNNAAIGGENGTHKGAGIYVTGSDAIVLELKGTNTVEGAPYSSDTDRVFSNAALSVDGNVTIKGSGKLQATAPRDGGYRSSAIFIGGNATLNSGNVTATGGDTGFMVGDHDEASTLTVAGGSLTATGGAEGISVYGDAVFSGGTTVATGGADQSGRGLCLNAAENYTSHEISLTGGTVTFKGAGESGAACNALVANIPYQNYVWTNKEGGKLTAEGMLKLTSVNYLHMEPGKYKISQQPGNTNGYTVEVGQTSGKPVSNKASVAYRWYTAKTYDVVPESAAQGADQVGAVQVPIGGDGLGTIEFANGLWEAEVTNGVLLSATYLLIPAKAGETISLKITSGNAFAWDNEEEIPDGAILWCGGDDMTMRALTLADGVYSGKVHREHLLVYDEELEDYLPSTEAEGETCVILAVFSWEARKFQLSKTVLTEVESTGEEANIFASATAGEYCAIATVKESGATVGILQSDAFQYTPTDPAVGAVETLIGALPEAVTQADGEQVQAARDAYDALTDDQKAKVNPAVLEKLQNAEQALQGGDSTQPTDTQPTTGVTQPTGGGDNPEDGEKKDAPWLWIILIAVAAAVAAVILLLTRKKKAQ